MRRGTIIRFLFWWDLVILLVQVVLGGRNYRNYPPPDGPILEGPYNPNPDHHAHMRVIRYPTPSSIPSYIIDDDPETGSINHTIPYFPTSSTSTYHHHYVLPYPKAMKKYKRIVMPPQYKVNYYEKPLQKQIPETHPLIHHQNGPPYFLPSPPPPAPHPPMRIHPSAPNHSAVGLLGLLALMGSIQHMMNELDKMALASKKKPHMSGNMDYDYGPPRPPPGPRPPPSLRPPFTPRPDSQNPNPNEPQPQPGSAPQDPNNQFAGKKNGNNNAESILN